METALHRDAFDKVKNSVIKEWEINTGQVWPTYAEDVISARTGKVIRSAGDKYDAHHIIENCYKGEHEWWNIHPAEFPTKHQGGIHGSGSPANELFKGGNK
jgi:predicted ribonuclease toxin of YeeF-YezG toxin-antitoxin module